MIAIAAIAFALLVVAWFFGPNAEQEPVADVGGATLKVGEAAA
jgi:hypothetical protein